MLTKKLSEAAATKTQLDNKLSTISSQMQRQDHDIRILQQKLTSSRVSSQSISAIKDINERLRQENEELSTKL